MKRIDKVRQMSSKELALMLDCISRCCQSQMMCQDCPLGEYCSECCSPATIKEWLEQEVQEDA